MLGHLHNHADENAHIHTLAHLRGHHHHDEEAHQLEVPHEGGSVVLATARTAATAGAEVGLGRQVGRATATGSEV